MVQVARILLFPKPKCVTGDTFLNAFLFQNGQIIQYKWTNVFEFVLDGENQTHIPPNISATRIAGIPIVKACQ